MSAMSNYMTESQTYNKLRDMGVTPGWAGIAIGQALDEPGKWSAPVRGWNDKGAPVSVAYYPNYGQFTLVPRNPNHFD